MVMPSRLFGSPIRDISAVKAHCPDSHQQLLEFIRVTCQLQALSLEDWLLLLVIESLPQ